MTKSMITCSSCGSSYSEHAAKCPKCRASRPGVHVPSFCCRSCHKIIPIEEAYSYSKSGSYSGTVTGNSVTLTQSVSTFVKSCPECNDPFPRKRWFDITNSWVALILFLFTESILWNLDYLKYSHHQNSQERYRQAEMLHIIVVFVLWPFLYFFFIRYLWIGFTYMIRRYLEMQEVKKYS